jgi:Fur family ferric uptake transcriptional regulator
MAERRTRQKIAVLTVLDEAQAPLSPAQIQTRAQHYVPTIGQATVYRILKSLLEREAISTVQLPGESPLYEMAGKRHHHFFRCRGCEQMYEVVGCDTLLKRLVPPGFALEAHEVYLLGLCAECRRRQ